MGRATPPPSCVAADRVHGLGLGPGRLERVAARVGSDVPFFVRGGAQWAEGRGERLGPADVAPFAAVLAKPALGLPTAAVYRAFDRLPAPPPPPPEIVAEPSNHLAYGDLVACARNDLWGAALALAPALGATARALGAAGADAVLLCGSGSCVAGLFPDRGRAEARGGRAGRGGLPRRGDRAGGPARPQRLMVIPAASRSKVSGVTPCSRRGTFWTRSVGVLGSASTKRM